LRIGESERVRIAFVSYEYPPETGGGGIGAYLECVAPALAEVGHEVTVFCGGEATQKARSGGLTVQRVGAKSENFDVGVCQSFAVHHQRKPFDLIEVTDFAAWGLEIQRMFPNLPSVVKLHTPAFVIDQLHWRRPNIRQRLRMGLGTLRQGHSWPHFHFRYGPGHLREMETIRRAQGVAAPTAAVLQRIAQEIPEAAAEARVYPYPFLPPPVLLAAEAAGAGDVVTYVGRLEPRKGVLDLAAAIPAICRRHLDIRFRFIGRDMPSNVSGLSCSEVILQMAGPFRRQVEILPAQPREEALRLMAESSICVFPSHWESFGIVTLEAMAGARAVVVTAGSGMAELVSDGQTGVIVRPNDPEDLAAAITGLLGDPSLRRQLGLNACRRVVERFSLEAVVPTQLDHYQSLVTRRGTAAATH
jgi:glycogen(starch) synthase